MRNAAIIIPPLPLAEIEAVMAELRVALAELRAVAMRQRKISENV
jgi:hypothetical protein